MRRVYYLLLVTFVICILSSNTWAWPYSAKIGELKETSNQPYNPGIFASFTFGPIEQNWAWINCTNGQCIMPPPVFWVVVEWNSPNTPDCWIPAYMAILGSPWIVWGSYGQYPSQNGGGKTLLGNGRCGMLNEFGPECLLYLQPGYNTFYIETGPLVSGKYRIRTISINWPNWKYDYTLCEEDKPNNMWDNPYFYLDDEDLVEVRDQCDDIMRIAELFYLDSTETKKIYDGGIIGVFPRYHLVCMVQSTKRSEDMPPYMYANFFPEGMEEPTEMHFERRPRLDYGQCDPEAHLRTYAYVSEKPIRPFDLWNYPPEVWSSLARDLVCEFTLPPQPVLAADGSITVTVVSQLVVKYLNDTTGCFIAAKPENAKFLVLVGDDLGLNNNAPISFNIENCNQQLVYKKTLYLGSFTPDSNSFGIPDVPRHKTPVTWNGRCNQWTGLMHLADPENDPYRAYASIYDGGIRSLKDSLNVVPRLDSVIVTHNPSWPPPVYNDSVSIYSIIYAKIDDFGDSISNHRYYYRTEQESVYYIDINCDNQYVFHSLDNVGFVEDNNALTIMPASWKTDYWGTIDYQWTVVRDSANKIGAQHIYYYSNDTTAQWGNIWNPRIVHRIRSGHWRIFVKSKVTNKIETRLLQEKVSPDTSKAHKVIFGPSHAEPWNVLDYAETYLGTPYYYGGKKPYYRIDCSGFVTAVKIQDRDLLQDNVYSLNEIGVCHYVQTWYMHGNRQITIDTTISERDVLPGDLIALKEYGDKGYSHIVLVEQCRIGTFGIESASIIHAKGGVSPDMRRVRRDNLLETYKKVNVRKKTGYYYKFLRYKQ